MERRRVNRIEGHNAHVRALLLGCRPNGGCVMLPFLAFIHSIQFIDSIQTKSLSQQQQTNARLQLNRIE